MKYKLPSVTAMKPPAPGRLVQQFVAILLISTLASPQEPRAPEPPSGQLLVAQAASQMTLHPSLEAKMRQRVGIGEQYLVGSGAYLQLRHGEDVRFRLELRLQVGDRLTSLQHITDNRYLYIRRDIGETKTVSRIDLKRVQAAQAKLSAGTAASRYDSMGVGGLAQLLHGLADNFEFGDPESETISGVNVWRINGRWKPEMLAKLVPEQSDAIREGLEVTLSQLPPQIPHQVSLVVGRDTPLPLFPYRVEFSREAGESNTQRSILIMELFEVRLRPDLDPRLFEVPDGEQNLVDETDAYLRKHGLTPAE